MDESAKNSPCKECNDAADGVQLQAEVEHLRQHLAERDAHIVALENEFVKCTTRTNDLEEQVGTWREKYDRLYDSHIRVQKLNQVLEDKLLQMVDKMKSEKSQLTKDIATLSVRLAESKHNYSMLQKENERYKNDMNLAIQLLQCKPDNFVSQKLDSLPLDTQARVSQYVMSKTPKLPSSSQSKNGNDNPDPFDTSEYEFNISASLMSKILEDSIQDTLTKHCDTCTCSKTQNKPFSYNESYYSVATQTIITGDMRNTHCLNCNPEIKSLHSNLSIRSTSPRGIKLVNDNAVHGLTIPMCIPQQTECHKVLHEPLVEEPNINCITNDKAKFDEKTKLEEKNAQDVTFSNIEETMHFRRNSVNMEPSVHHKSCDRTKTSASSKKSSIHSVGNEDLLIKDIPNNKEMKSKHESVSGDNTSLRKNSQSSMGAVSRTSSVAKSTVSTHKSHTQVGPGPRFCHLRMQAGSKNILLDNAQPDVPPILYKRQSKCNENPIFKDLNDGMDNFIDLDKSDDDAKINAVNDNIVVESTLIDVHVDNNNKEPSTAVKNTSINPNVLLNVSSSPLQPLKTHSSLKTHSFLSNLENNNNQTQSFESPQNVSEIDNLLNDFSPDKKKSENNNYQDKNDNGKRNVTPTDNHEVKIFNFDRYEQSKLATHYARPLRKIEMTHLHSLENTKISKDLPPQIKMETKINAVKSSMPAIVNVYPNLTQTHLKVNESKKVFTNEHSTSSLSSDDSAALLQKQQLLRVAEWVEQNLEQQNNLNDPLEDDVSFNRAMRRDSKLSRLTESLNELALNMPHPVSKYSKSYGRDNHNNCVHNNFVAQETLVERSTSPSKLNTKVVNNIVKETMFPVEYGDVAITEINTDNIKKYTRHTNKEFDVGKELRDTFGSNGDKEISAEELARMEYNVKKFLLSGPYWTNNTETIGRSRRTSSKTETDV